MQDTLPTNGESKVRKVLFNEVTMVVAIIGVVVGVMNWVRNPQEESNRAIVQMDKNISLIQKDINTINSNHEAHIQDILKEIEEIKKREESRDKELQEEHDTLILLLERIK